MDLPAPLGPTIVSRRPAGMANVTSSSARRSRSGTGSHAIEGNGRWSGTSLLPVDRDATGTLGAGASRIANSRPAATWPAPPRVVALRQDAQRQEELGRDDEHGEGALEGQLTDHQPQAHLDGDQRHGHCAGPVEHEPSRNALRRTSSVVSPNCG